jgi:hypothetical protein
MAAEYPRGATKTTFVLSDSRRARLKAVAIARSKTVTDLLAEGADLVLAKYERTADQETLMAKARAARERLRAGLFDAPFSASDIDDVLYAPARRAKSKAQQANNRRKK